MNKSIDSRKDNKYSKKDTAFMVIFYSLIGGILGVGLIVSFLELLSTIFNASNRAIMINYYGISINSFFNEIVIAPKTYLMLFVISTCIFMTIFASMAIKDTYA